MKGFKNISMLFLAVVLVLFANGQQAYGQTGRFPKTSSKLAVPGKKKNMSRLNSAERLVQFIGAGKDSVTFGSVDNSVLNAYAGSVTMARSDEQPANADSGIVILIDTNQVIGVEEDNYSSKTVTTAKYDAYPVIVKNISGKNLVVGSGRKIPVYIEALNANNDWRPIENDWTNPASSSATKIILKPGDIVGVGIPVSSGNFKTLLRVRIFDNYSEPFTGYINASQFLETGR